MLRITETLIEQWHDFFFQWETFLLFDHPHLDVAPKVTICKGVKVATSMTLSW